MNQEQKFLVTQAICKRFEQMHHVDEEVLKKEATALIGAVKLVNQPDLVTTGVNVTVDSNKGLVDGFDVGTNAVGSVGSADGGVVGLSTGSAEIGLSFDEVIQAIKSVNSVAFVVGHK